MSKRTQALVALVIVIVGLGVALLIPGVRHLIVNYNNDKAFALMNRDRTSNSPYPALHHESHLQAYAQHWANHMASTGVLEHDSIQNHVCCWRELGENVGTGPTIEDIEQAFMKSPEHRYNILYPSFTQAGVGVAWNSKQKVFYVDQAFRDPTKAASRRTTPHRTLRPTPTQTPTPTGSKLIPSPSPSATPTLVLTPPPITPTGMPLPTHHSNAARIVFAAVIVFGAGLLAWFVYTRRRK